MMKLTDPNSFLFIYYFFFLFAFFGPKFWLGIENPELSRGTLPLTPLLHYRLRSIKPAFCFPTLVLPCQSEQKVKLQSPTVRSNSGLARAHLITYITQVYLLRRNYGARLHVRRTFINIFVMRPESLNKNLVLQSHILLRTTACIKSYILWKKN